MSRQATVTWTDDEGNEKVLEGSMDDLEPSIMELQEQGIEYQLVEHNPEG